jgi:uncharacterized protein YceH (UPF0502 family)
MKTGVPQLDQVEARILGCLIEKQHTTPAGYPLTLNSLRLACNQSTNREPVVDFDEQLIFDSIQRLHRLELTRPAGGHSSRASKYRHLVGERLGLDDAGEALLAVLLLRGAQTPGELKTRTERIFAFDDLAELELALDALVAAGLVERLDRRPGEKQPRVRELLTGGRAPEVAEDDEVGADSSQPDKLVALAARVAALELQVAELRGRLDDDR